MRVAIVGSRKVPADIEEIILSYLPAMTTEIVSGGADGVDTAAKTVAARLGIPCKEMLPDYARFGKRAPLVRNDDIIDYADMVLAFWDGKSHGTQYVIGECLKKSKYIRYIPIEGE
ncbi:MAG: hypothetical protein IKV35_03020 [Clostridia bacterium]|nr:hypothetical protein [Clostridia bacterium]